MPRTCALLAVLLLPALARAEDWPQWLGPRRDGTSTEVVKPWKGDPKSLWRVPVGEGHSSPIVANGWVFLHTKVANKDEEVVQAFDAATGTVRASAGFPRAPFSSPFGGGPRATPAYLGDSVFSLGVTGVLSRTLMEPMNKGSHVESGFSVETLKQFKASNLTFGVSASPLLEGDNVITLVGGKGASVVAFNKQTGKVAWQALDDAASYASPIAIGEGPKRQVVALTAGGLVALAPADGKLIWRYPFKDLLSESSTTPVKVGDLLVASSVTLGAVALKLTEKDGQPGVQEAWRNRDLNCYFSTPVPVGDHLYMITGSLGLRPSITLRCVETATGKIAWSRPNIGRYHAALLRTGDNKLLMLDDAGRLTMIDPDPKGYREVARSKVCGETWAHPALSNGRLYLRDARELICLQLGE
jgi:outer membrane protein assembly factor BamB